MKLSINIAANFLGRAWVAGIGIVMVPLYIKFLGIESYGLVGFYSTLIGSMGLLDLGLSTTLNRELTKARVEKTDATTVRNLVFTLECIYWSIGLLIAVCVVALAPAIATHWLQAKNLPVQTVSKAVILMGAVMAFQWPISLYNGGMYGLDKQVTDNTIMVCMTTLRSVGVVLLLWLVAPTIEVFFIWQAIISFIYVFAMRTGLWYYLPKANTWPKFSKDQLKLIWRFAAGMTSISIVGFLLMQADKIVLSKVLPLSQFAYYILAFTVAGGINMIVNPINAAIFPRLTAFVTSNDRPGLINAYHKACRLIALTVFPVGLILIFFASNILLIWTKNPVTVAKTTLMVQILVTGTIINSLMVIPYLLQVAYGKTRLSFYQNLIAAIILVPLLFWWVHLYGAVGGTFVWLAVNTGSLLITIPIIHNTLLKGELKNWCINDVFIPLLPNLISITVIKLIVNKYPEILKLNLWGIGIIFLLVVFISSFFISEMRELKKRVRTAILKS
ncbi:lipopolysaccharide biosynthesis protein [Mucilaginibacter sp. UYCu711]|uniref:lipopolysaccharide biosynthesis protein n=1 Tax=Mucilaginibacter sp. UYCu711 TaxID=3156339 RepID=UPI003D1AE1F5